ncbi:MAG: hypothetical protein WBB64_10310 [Anaerolineales bacterium]
MYEVNQAPASEKFSAAWLSAAKHLQNQGGESIKWLRTDLNPPIAEHLSFFIGNQLVFVFVGVEGVRSPSPRSFFLEAANEAKAIPALLPMKYNDTEFQPMQPGWGLIDAKTYRLLDPTNLVSNELIEMSDWEVHDFAIQVLVNFVKENSSAILSKQSSLHIDPSIWFRDSKGDSFVVVRSGRYPLMEAQRPENLIEIVRSCEPKSRLGYFASIIVANHDQQYSSEQIPLYRGQGMVVRFTELEPLNYA